MDRKQIIEWRKCLTSHLEQYKKTIQSLKLKFPDFDFCYSRNDLESMMHQKKKSRKEKCAKKVFVKWVQSDGKSIVDPKFHYEIGKQYQCTDFSVKETSLKGFYVLPIEDAISFGIQFGLFPFRNDVALVFVTLSNKTLFAYSSMRLYSVLRCSSLQTLTMIPVTAVQSDPKLEIKNELSDRITEREIWLLSFMLARRQQEFFFQSLERLLTFNWCTTLDVIYTKQNLSDLLAS